MLARTLPAGAVLAGALVVVVSAYVVAGALLPRPAPAGWGLAVGEVPGREVDLVAGTAGDVVAVVVGGI